MERHLKLCLQSLQNDKKKTSLTVKMLRFQLMFGKSSRRMKFRFEILGEALMDMIPKNFFNYGQKKINSK